MESSTTNTQSISLIGRIGRTKLAYAGAVLDCEGHVTGWLYQHPKGRQPYAQVRIGVTNTDQRLLNWLITLFGGKVYKKVKGPLSKKDCYEWRPADTLWFLKLVMPFMIVKQRQARLVIAFLSLPRVAVAKKRRIALLIRALNRR
jgi:hypothetical protein